jgi:N-acetylneuraminic acid mutarotase
MISTIGAKPACLVNASVTYVGDDQIYAFGGFDQYTDEGVYTVLETLRGVSVRMRDAEKVET